MDAYAADNPTPTEVGDEAEVRDAQPDVEPSGDNGGPSDEALQEALERDGTRLKDLTPDDEEERSGAAAVRAVRDGHRPSEGEKSEALNWFLNEDPNATGENVKTLELNFGTDENERWVPWTIQPVEMEVMRAIRKKAGSTRAARVTGEADEYRINLEIVVEGTLDPDIKEAARVFAEEGRGPGDPVDALRAKFAKKPGFIAQLAGEIMTLSGFNDDDVRDAERGAKN